VAGSLRCPLRPNEPLGRNGFLDVLRHPLRIVRASGPEEGVSDIDAVRQGEARAVGCFLRGEMRPYPKSVIARHRGLSYWHHPGNVCVVVPLVVVTLPATGCAFPGHQAA